jgi:NAD(P)-dependent dehydrogenase (short-subunit alcohol dehydrogenase family)
MTAGKQGCAIVTGGSRGLGLATARALAATGRPVVIAARGREDLRAAAAELQADGADVLAVPADVAEGHAVGELVLRAVERFGEIDVLVNNAGALPVTEELDRLDWETWRRHIDVDLRGVFNTGQRVGPLMRRQGHGTIVNVASAAAAAATALHVSYSPAQAAIISLSRCMDAWLAGAGVAVHCLCDPDPGRRGGEDGGDDLRRRGRPDDGGLAPAALPGSRHGARGLWCGRRRARRRPRRRRLARRRGRPGAMDLPRAAQCASSRVLNASAGSTPAPAPRT